MFFHLNECGEETRDQEGLDLPDLDAARAAAMKAAREVMCAELVEGRLCLGCHIEVVDVGGATLLKVPFNEAVTITGDRPPSKF